MKATNFSQSIRKIFFYLQHYQGALFVALFFWSTIRDPLYNLVLFGIIIALLSNCIQNTKSTFNALIQNHGTYLIGAMFLSLWIPQFLSLPDSVNTERSIIKSLLYLFYLPCTLYLVKRLEEKNVRNLAYSGIIAFIVFVTISTICDWLLQDGTALFTLGVFTTPYNGHMLAFALPILVLLFSRNQPYYKQILFFLLLLAVLLAIVLSGKRMAFLMAVVGLVLMTGCFLLQRNWKTFSVFVVGLTVTTLFAGGAIWVKTTKASPETHENTFTTRMFTNTVKTILGQETKDPSINDRQKIHKLSVDLSKLHWINGVGYRAFRTAASKLYQDYNLPEPPLHTHMTILEVVVETGIIGFIGFIVVLMFLIKVFLSIIREKIYDAMPIFCVVTIIIIPVSSHFSFYGTLVSSLFWITTALLVAEVYHRDNLR